ncbi:MAG: phosphate acyltransferase [Solirubrobacterales bacterium]|nr:phosphate acyltransferase [Solirubrobacterales bacterium]MDX6662271.1 phosphate acyltransferase [Solirubrobacterales bacterium]
MSTVALDAFGADRGYAEVLAGARLAAADGIRIRLFGPPSELAEAGEGIELCAAEEWITNEDEPVAAVRGRPSASVVLAARDVAEGSSDALVSAGSTGATMTASLFALKRLQGVQRPALAAVLPLPEKQVLLLDCGANVEVRAQHLIQFAYLGSSFVEAVLGVARPRVALLSVGEEQSKGTAEVVEAGQALASASGINFAGNAEGRDLPTGEFDVVVTDGFTGNIALKLLEGTAKVVGGAVRDAARSNPLSLAGGLLMRPALGKLRRQLAPDTTGGAILLGLRGVSVVAHGSSSAEGIANAVRLADRAVRERTVERTGEALERAGATRQGLRRPDGRDTQTR